MGRFERSDGRQANDRNRRIFLLVAHPGESRITQVQRTLRLDGGNWSSCPYAVIEMSLGNGGVRWKPVIRRCAPNGSRLKRLPE